MAAGGEALTWRRKILQKLEIRNQKDVQTFSELIKAHNKMFETADTSIAKIKQLEIEVFQLQQERVELQGRIQELNSGVTTPGGAPVQSEKIASLEQKLFKAQEELTELHRRKSESAQQIIELNNNIRQKDEEIISKEGQLQDAMNNQEALKTECNNLAQVIVDLEKTNQVLKDELQVLQLEHTSLEEKHRKTQDENRELVERWMVQKSRDADKVNMDNEHLQRVRQAKLQKELLEAAKEPVNVPIPRSGSFHDAGPPVAPYCVITTIPSYPTTKFDAHDGEVLSARFSISGRLFATGGGDKKVKVWEMVNDVCLGKGTMHGCSFAVTSVQFDPQERLILAASNDHACRVWTVGDERLRHTLTGHSNKVMTAKFMGDSTRVVSGSHDRTLKIWDLRSKACIRTIFAGSSCNDLVINEGLGSQIVSGHFDKRIRLWDTRSDSVKGEISLQGKVTSLDLSPDMNQLLASTRDDTLKVIDLRMSQVVSTCSAEGFRLATDWSRAQFSPDGQYVMCGSQDGSVYIWNNSTSKIEKVLREHSSAVIVSAWHPSGYVIISCDRNKHAIVWTDKYG